MIFIIIGLVFLFFIKRLISKLEYSTTEYPDGYYGGRETVWHDIKFPLWAWLLAVFFLCTPILGIILYVVAWVVVSMLVNEDYIRFKKGKSSLFMKFIDILNKEY